MGVLVLYVFDNHKYSSKIKNYHTLISIKYNTLCFDIGLPEKTQKNKRTRKHNMFGNINGIRKELLEYHCGIYRMFPCGKQHQYHMQYLHINGVTKRSIN